MNVYIDGLIYRCQERGGISRIFSEIVPLVSRHPDVNECSLVAPRQVKQVVPSAEGLRTVFSSPAFFDRFPSNKVVNLLMRFYEQCVTPAVLNDKNAIWHMSYYLRPYPWKGKLVVQVYDMIHELYADHYPDDLGGTGNRRFMAYKRDAVKNADAIICISHQTKKDLCSLLDVDPAMVHVVHLSHSPVFKVCADQKKDSNEKPFILYVGGRKAYKNFDTLLEAYSEWTRKNEVNLLTVGYPLSEAESSKIKSLNIEDSVISKSGVDDLMLNQLYNQAEAFVFPSIYEGFGIPLLEAMACGCPVIASDIPTSREMADGVALFFDPLNKAELVQKLDEAVALKRQGRLVEAGFERAKEFSWEKTAEGIVDVYAAVLGT